MYGQPLNENDAATPAQRARMAFLQDQLHAIGLARQQARARGDTATDTALGKLADKLDAERRTLEAQIISQAQGQVTRAESGLYDSPLEKLAGSIRKAAVYGGLALGAYLLLPLLLRKRGGSRG